MLAELQMLSPLVPVRPLKFLRFSKQHAEGVWAVVDVSVDIHQDASSMNCRRLPSGFIVQDMPNGYSKVNIDWLIRLSVNFNTMFLMRLLNCLHNKSVENKAR